MGDTAIVCTKCANLDIYKYGDGVTAWSYKKPNLNALETELLNNGSPLTIVIAKADDLRKCETCRPAFTRAFRIPGLWWTDWIRKSSAHFGSEDTENEAGLLDGHSTWFRFDVKHVSDSKAKIPEYVWWKINVFTRWDAATKSTCVLLFDPLADLKKELVNKYLIPKIEARYLAIRQTVTSPYYPHVLFAETSLDIHHSAIWNIRDLVRNIERDRLNKDVADPSSTRLTEGMRHAIHVSETCQTTMSSFQSVLESHKLWLKQNTIHINQSSSKDPNAVDGQFNPHVPNISNRQITSRLTNAITALSTQLKRAASNHARLTSEIQLSIHTFSQSVAIAAQEDSRIMKSLTYLGVVFLPATFISALFSTSFFNTDDNGNWYTHPEFWIFWAVTIPVTAGAVFCVWYWRKRTRTKSTKTILHQGGDPYNVQDARRRLTGLMDDGTRDIQLEAVRRRTWASYAFKNSKRVDSDV